MAKRSPILGYNHNVRYRGLVFHVQTEDSGVLAPHLFTHLFHNGVIVSTRKYVYDSGATEEAIKSLMQAQHKAVMKELRRGLFDDKIDQYLGGTPGLLPRESAGAGAADPGDSDQTTKQPAAASEPRLPPAEIVPDPVGDIAGDDGLGGATLVGVELAISRETTLEEPALALRPTEEAVEPPPMARVMMAERAGAPTHVRTRSPAQGVPPVPAPPEPPRPGPRVRARAVIVDDFETVPNEALIDTQTDTPADSHSGITIQLEADEPEMLPPRNRRPADTETGPWDQTRIDLSLSMISDGVPGTLPGAVTIRNPGEASGPVPSGSTGPITSPLSQRAAKAVGAASLPPARPIARPPTRPAIPIVRTTTPDDRRTPPPEVLEGLAAAAAQAAELPGQYAPHQKISPRPPTDAERDRGQPSQSAIPQPVGRQGSTPNIPQPPARSTPIAARASAQPAQPVPQPPPAPPAQRATPMPIPVPARPGAPTPPSPTPIAARAATPSPAPPPARPSTAVPPQRATPLPMAVRASGEPRPRTPTPPRVSATTPAAGTPGLAPGRATTPSPASGVVMTRPAVIVGSPAKPAAVTTPRIRKARETAGRGFGQALISEKSLDEVILAYLSEDAEDK